ncbi:thiamine pyrophosphate-dependent enzyme [Granulicella sp. dw_53]|uniref:thiamine pyrophosphate-dependent enzyme n=1 Tax=Granulicella sp. dw_53 TaxID=2719792 RepID=UPI001BD47D96|nr:thiamine pyrophosphate-dependent enzyme [Granulicella sp. dw_53]
MGATADSRNLKRGAKAKKQKKTNGDEAVKSAAVKSVPVFENPLVPNVVLRQMYQKMAESRLLGEYALRAGRKAKGAIALKSTNGQEACRVSVTQGLGDGDVVLDSQPGELMEYLLGAKLSEILRRLSGDTKSKQAKSTGETKPLPTGLLPFVKEAEERLFAGLGAALLLKRLNRPNGVVIFVEHKEVSNGTWRRAFTLAAAQNLSVIFVLLAGAKLGKDKGKAGVSDIALSCGVPGIPVDASDAVALYRVAQETMGRIRSGEGAVLIEGIPFPAPGEDRAIADPVAAMKASLLQRQIATEEWIAGVEKEFRRQLSVGAK